MRKIKVLIKRPDSKPYITWISDTLENIQKTVGGFIETVTISEDMVIVCDEEGRLKGKEANCKICNVSFVGTIFVCGVSEDEFCDIPINLDDAKTLFPDMFR